MKRRSRGTLVIDVDACKGCELCIPACPPQVLTMSRDKNALGYFYPELVDGCTGCTACQLVCPDFVIDVFCLPQLDEPEQDEAEQDLQA